jgi:hypothetical protein
MSKPKNDSLQWFLRIAGGTVFGPVPLKSLVVWAEQGRIVPGNEVSPDRENWVKAETIPELEMKWFVDDGAGKTVGPFNRLAAESFLKSGKAPAGARIVETPSPAAEPETPQKPTLPVSDASAETRKNAPKLPVSDASPATAKPDEIPVATVAARPASKSPSSLESERDELRAQIQELKTQMENFRANSEKDARQRERKLESLKKEVAHLQEEQTAAKIEEPVLKLSADPVVTAAPEDQASAMDELRRAADDERRLHVREVETLRAKLQSREDEFARLDASEKSARAEMEALREEAESAAQESEDLRKNLDAATQTLAAHRASATANESRLAALASQVGRLETECRELTTEREILRKQLGAAMGAAADAASETINADLRRRVEQLEAVTAGLRTELAQADKELADERASKAELLDEANSREVANRQHVEELEAKIAEFATKLRDIGPPGEREARLAAELSDVRTRLAEAQARFARSPEDTGDAATPPVADVWMQRYATDEVAMLEKALKDERDSFSAFRQLSTTRQDAILERIQTMRRLLADDSNESRNRMARGRLDNLDQNRRQNELDLLRLEHQKKARQFEEREAELLRRVRVLETEDARLRSMLDNSDLEGGRRHELTEKIHLREQDLAQERRLREQEREQAQQAQLALLKRIEGLERGGATEAPAADDPDEQNSRRASRLTSWLKR